MLGLKDTSPISRWEKGLSLPSLIHLFRLARIYKTMPNEMYFELWQNSSKELFSEEFNRLTHHESLTR